MNGTKAAPMRRIWGVVGVICGVLLFPAAGSAQEGAERQKAPTMAEAAETAPPGVGSPEEALRLLKEGNVRFSRGEVRGKPLSAQARRAMALKQTPFAVVLGCSDSRVPVEIVFDQGPGDIFSVRVAGNTVTTATLGSVEYAVANLASPLVVVMGHQSCGAVVAALGPVEELGEADNVRYLVEQIHPAIKDVPAGPGRDKARLRKAVVANVRWQVEEMKKSPIVAKALEEGKVEVVGAYFDISTGEVEFLDSDGEPQAGSPDGAGAR